MKIRNIVILCLLFVGVVSFGIVQGIVTPQLAENAEKYAADQQNPLTHDVTSVLKYRSKYMGNFSNIANLVGTLPLGNIDKTFQLFPDVFTLEINFKESSSTLDVKYLETSLIYNATVLFSLIDNLDAIHFSFEGDSYKVIRSDVAQWYDENLSTLTDEDTWYERVQSKLTDEDYVFDGMETLFLKD
ncbi:hypothetical protein J2T13_004503 [Paenibacillus sp. DS2015]|uniref:DUF4825 domain-containing protein n=1 Tax=Paenibacillus sp. DS2015 TaxID=3373917 RepID=UPI003D228499